ncbi:hypothetical protein ACDA63_15620 [Uliginosibacterium sp. sgz301328]|uniref:hypothetical protein n=1 Tax=Uliginosibacterium sp. sgz301328 TaxID=3243764 RepID=UPI00359EC52F
MPDDKHLLSSTDDATKLLTLVALGIAVIAAFRAVLNLQTAGSTTRWRVRALPESVNQQPGCGICQGEIGFTPPDEAVTAKALAKALYDRGSTAALHETSYPTPGYVSVFVCQ